MNGLFFDLLQRALWGKKTGLSLSDNEQAVKSGLHDVLKLAKSQTLSGLIYNELLNDPVLSGFFPDTARQKMKNTIFSIMHTHAVLNSAIAQVVTAFDEADIPSVVLKGQGLASYYPIPELRQCGDIDIYVGIKNYSRACDIVDALNGGVSGSEEAAETEMHYHTMLGEVTVEIHRQVGLMYGRIMNSNFQAFALDGTTKNLVPGRAGGVTYMTLSDNFNAYFIFYHFFRHFIQGGIGLRQLCDWVLFLHMRHNELDFKYIEHEVRQLRTLGAWKVFACIAVDYLGLPAEEMPMYDPKYRKKARRALEIILADGNFGTSRVYAVKRPKDYLLGKMYSFVLHNKRFFRTVSIVPYQALSYYWNMLAGGFRRIRLDVTHTEVSYK